MNRANLTILLLSSSLLLLTTNCFNFKSVKRTTTAPRDYQTLDQRSPYLKAHMKNCRVFVLSGWLIGQDEQTVAGHGALLGVNRDTLQTGDFTVSIDSVAIFETNVVQTSPAVAALTIVTGISAAITVACLSNPKSCFGSCPTFYNADDTSGVLHAEGYSSSIAPALEATDLDALARLRPEDSTLRLAMTNEALETHVVRQVDLIVVEQGSKSGRVFKDTMGNFWQAEKLQPPSMSLAAEGDATALLAEMDGEERFSLADSTNLAAQEIITLEFESRQTGQAGVVIACRQTLLSTYLLYQTLSYMGNKVADWFALLNKHPRDPKDTKLSNMLGNIEILAADSAGTWQVVGSVGEHGPLATDVYVVPLPPAVQSNPARFQLRMNRGNWRIDYVALASLSGTIGSRRVKPARVMRAEIADDRALELLLDERFVLTTLPGDKYILEYNLPEDVQYPEVFLESRGYYLEWMRQEWLAEESPGQVAGILFSTESMLRKLAPEYKKVESRMEETFWRSRFAKP